MDFQKTNTTFFPGEKTYKEAVTKQTNTTHTNNVAILGDSIISINNINKTLRTGHTRFENFPGASSKDLLHYIDSTLEGLSFEAAIMHVGTDDIGTM